MYLTVNTTFALLLSLTRRAWCQEYDCTWWPYSPSLHTWKKSSDGHHPVTILFY